MEKETIKLDKLLSMDLGALSDWMIDKSINFENVILSNDCESKECFTLPDGSVTEFPEVAADAWAAAFYKAKDAIVGIRNIPRLLITRRPVRNLDEVLAECDSVLEMGDNGY